MPAYLIYVQEEVTDPDLMAQYRAGVADTVAKYGGKNLAASPNFESIEGTWDGSTVVVSEYPDMETLKAWYNSEDYKPFLELRLKGSRGRMIFVEGN